MLKKALSSLKQNFRRHGVLRLAQIASSRVINKFVYLERLKLVALPNQPVLRHQSAMEQEPMRSRMPLFHTTPNSTSRWATEAEILQMLSEPKWRMGEGHRKRASIPKSCLLSMVDGVVAGYAWIDDSLEINPMFDLMLELPSGWVYSYATFTLPEFRGLGLQTKRHHDALRLVQDCKPQGLLAFACHTNTPSRKAQARSGFKPVGTIWIVKIFGRQFVWMSPDAYRFGFDISTKPARISKNHSVISSKPTTFAG